MDPAIVKSRTTWGSLALGTWIFLFCGGMLLETKGHREQLAPSYYTMLEAQNRAALNPEAAQPTAQDPPQPAGDAVAPGTSAAATLELPASLVWSFVVSALFYAPLNLAFLTMAAGLLGGCSSNLAIDTVEPATKISQRYMSELPWSGMVRSFIVYLCLIAGLYFALESPFKDTTPPQYLRLAGTFSLLGFIVGYDPTKFRQWLDAVPGPRPASGGSPPPPPPPPPPSPKGDAEKDALVPPISPLGDDQGVYVETGGGNAPKPK